MCFILAGDNIVGMMTGPEKRQGGRNTRAVGNHFQAGYVAVCHNELEAVKITLLTVVILFQIVILVKLFYPGMRATLSRCFCGKRANDAVGADGAVNDCGANADSRLSKII